MMDSLIQQWNQLPPATRNLLLRVGLALLTLILFWVLRRLLATIVVAPLRRLAKHTSATWDDILLDAITVPARFLIIAVGLAVGAQILQVDFATDRFVQQLVRTFIIIAIFMTVYRAVDLLAPNTARLFRLTGLTITERLLPFARTAVKVVLLAVGLVIIIQEWGYDVSGLVAGLGLGGLAFSLAAKDTVENLFGFTTIVGDQPFIVGEFIKTPDVEGIVEHVGIRSTRIRQLDQAYVSVPNSKLASSAILNWSRLSKRRIDFVLGIDYRATASDLETLLERLRSLLKGHGKVEAESVIVYLINFGADSYEILVRCYVLLPDWIEFTAEKEKLMLQILHILDELNLKIAFTGRSVYIESVPPQFTGAPSSTEEQDPK
jgi:MscS family membrane protein